MKLMILHDLNNPNQEVPMDAEDFAVAVPCLGSGSAVRLKSSDQPIAVHESPREVVNILTEALNG